MNTCERKDAIPTQVLYAWPHQSTRHLRCLSCHSGSFLLLEGPPSLYNSPWLSRRCFSLVRPSVILPMLAVSHCFGYSVAMVLRVRTKEYACKEVPASFAFLPVPSPMIFFPSLLEQGLWHLVPLPPWQHVLMLTVIGSLWSFCQLCGVHYRPLCVPCTVECAQLQVCCGCELLLGCHCVGRQTV